jgi:hypothetical protein
MPRRPKPIAPIDGARGQGGEEGIKWTKKVEPALQKTLRAIPAGRYKGPAPSKKGKAGIVVGEDHKGTGPLHPDGLR